MKTETIYVTDDGRKFDSESEAKAWEGALDSERDISEWLDARGTGTKKKVEYARLLMEWVARVVD